MNVCMQLFLCSYVLNFVFLGYMDPIMDIERKSNAKLTLGKDFSLPKKTCLVRLSLFA